MIRNKNNRNKHSKPEQIRLCQKYRQNIENKTIVKKSILNRIKEFITKIIIK